MIARSKIACAASLALSAALALTSLAACAEADPEMPTRVLALTGDANAGTAVYGRKCISCHGADGEGRGSMAAMVPALSDEDLAQVIAGGGHVSQDGMTDQEAADLMAYCRASWPG